MLKDSPEPVGLAWEWVEVRPGVVMLADPNVMVTNLRLFDSAQRAVVGMDLIRICNRIVHQLPWQGKVCAALSNKPEQDPVQTAMPQPMTADASLLGRHSLPPLPAAPQLSRHRLNAASHPQRRHMLTRASDQEERPQAELLRKAA